MIVNVISIAELPPNSPGHPVPSPKSVISRKLTAKRARQAVASWEGLYPGIAECRADEIDHLMRPSASQTPWFIGFPSSRQNPGNYCLIGRRVDYIHRRYNRNWEEVIGIILWGKHHFTIAEQELQILQAIDGRRTLRSVIDEIGCGPGTAACLERARRLAAHGVIDMVQARHAAEPQRERQLV